MGFSNLAFSGANTYVGIFSLFIHDKAQNKNKIVAMPLVLLLHLLGMCTTA